MRIVCCVPFCKNSRGDRKNDPVYEDTEYLCSAHWPLVSKRLKRRRTKLKRILRKDPNNDFLHYRVLAADCRTWELCKREAIEKAAGI